MTIIERLEAAGHAALDWTEHAAIRLVGELADGVQALSDLAASSPLVAMAIQAGKASALAHGVPITAIEHEGEAVLNLAEELVGSMKQPAPAPVPVAVDPEPVAAVAAADPDSAAPSAA
jgi:hypothetical protein